MNFEALEMEIPDFVCAVATLIEVYWVFDVEYSPLNRRTLSVQEHVMNIQHPPLSVLSRRFITALQKH